MKNLKILFIFLLCFFVFSLAVYAQQPSDQQGGQKVEISRGQTVVVPGTGLELTFIRATEDSRCPENVQCIWAGVLVVEIEVKSGNGERKKILITDTPFRGKASTDALPSYVIDGYTIELFSANAKASVITLSVFKADQKE